MRLIYSAQYLHIIIYIPKKRQKSLFILQCYEQCTSCFTQFPFPFLPMRRWCRDGAIWVDFVVFSVQSFMFLLSFHFFRNLRCFCFLCLFHLILVKIGGFHLFFVLGYSVVGSSILFGSFLSDFFLETLALFFSPYSKTTDIQHPISKPQT